MDHMRSEDTRTALLARHAPQTPHTKTPRDAMVSMQSSPSDRIASLELSIALSEAEQHNAELAEDVRQLTVRLSNAADAVADRNLETQRLERRLGRAIDLINSLKSQHAKQLNQALVENENLIGAIRALENDVRMLKGVLRDRDREAKGERTELRALQDDLVNITAERDSLLKAKVGLETQESVNLRNYEKVASERDSVRAKNIELESELEIVRAKLNAQKKDWASQLDELKETKGSQKSELLDKIQLLKARNNELEEEIATLTASNRRTNGDIIASHNSQLDKMRLSHERIMEEAERGYNQAIDKASKTIKLLERDVLDLEKSKDVLTTELDDAKHQLRIMTGKMKNYEVEAEFTRQEIQTYKLAMERAQTNYSTMNNNMRFNDSQYFNNNNNAQASQAAAAAAAAAAQVQTQNIIANQVGRELLRSMSAASSQSTFENIVSTNTQGASKKQSTKAAGKKTPAKTYNKKQLTAPVVVPVATAPVVPSESAPVVVATKAKEVSKVSAPEETPVEEPAALEAPTVPSKTPTKQKESSPTSKQTSNKVNLLAELIDSPVQPKKKSTLSSDEESESVYNSADDMAAADVSKNAESKKPTKAASLKRTRSGKKKTSSNDNSDTNTDDHNEFSASETEAPSKSFETRNSTRYRPVDETINETENELVNTEIDADAEPPKRKRGRPRKHPLKEPKTPRTPKTPKAPKTPKPSKKKAVATGISLGLSTSTEASSAAPSAGSSTLNLRRLVGNSESSSGRPMSLAERASMINSNDNNNAATPTGNFMLNMSALNKAPSSVASSSNRTNDENAAATPGLNLDQISVISGSSTAPGTSAWKNFYGGRFSHLTKKN